MLACLIRSTIANLEGSALVQKFIFLDSKSGEIDDEYAMNVRAMAEQFGWSMVVNPGYGLRRQWLDAFAKVGGKLILNLEHDHEILVGCPSIGNVLKIFNDRTDINYLRLNRRDVLPEGYDVALSVGQNDREYGVVRTNLFSNTPHFLRRSFFERFIQNIVVEDNYTRILTTGAEGIEENINSYLASHIEPHLSPAIISRLMGTTIWGNWGEKGVIRNLGY
jgi:hypothetical protein